MACVIVMLASACTARRDISGLTPYAEIIGRTYQVVGDVSASAIYTDGEQPEYVMLHPRSIAVTGPEVAFTRPVVRGQTFRIVGAWMIDTAVDDTIYYLVEMTGNPFSPLPVRLPLDYNPSVDGDPGQPHYERVR